MSYYTTPPRTCECCGSMATLLLTSKLLPQARYLGCVWCEHAGIEPWWALVAFMACNYQRESLDHPRMGLGATHYGRTPDDVAWFAWFSMGGRFVALGADAPGQFRG